jgi:hypothetical protein
MSLGRVKAFIFSAVGLALLSDLTLGAGALPVRTVLLDIGRSNADGGWYGGTTPVSPDTNGNHWNTLDIGKYAGSMVDKAGTATSFGAGFIATNNPVFDWYNGPAGDNNTNNTLWLLDEAALGDLGNKDAAFDFVKGTNIQLALNGLTSGKKYRLNFYCSRRWEGDQTTTISVFSANTFDVSVKLAEDTVANRSASQGWVFNADTLLTLDNLTPSSSSLYVNIVGGNGGEGVLNAMSIQELDTTPPVIALQGNPSIEVTIGSNWSDPGATVSDNLDTPRTISGTGTVDLNNPGTYTLTYATSDASGNAAAQITRTVTVKYGVAKTVLLDIGRSNADGGWYGGTTPVSPDTNGNHWNTLDIGKYAGSMVDKAGTATSFGAGFIATNNPVFDWYNGPAGDNNTNNTLWLLDEAALGDLGNKDAAFDFVKGTNIQLALNGLTSGKKYRLNFYCSRRWEGDQTTTISVFSANTFDVSVKLAEDTVANRSASQGWVFNADTLLTLDNLTPSSSSLYVNIVGGNGGEGVLNAMSIQELDVPAPSDTTPPVITISGNNPETVIWGSAYSDAGATAEDAGVPVNVVTDSSAVNTGILGTYTVNYTSTDAAANIGSASRTVNVVLPANANVPSSDGLSPLLRYALGASSPSGAVTKPALSTDSNDLILTALIRTFGITAVGQSSTNLSATDAGFANLGSNPNGLPSADQTNLLPGTERREFRTPKNGTKQFLRLKVTQP